jgi:hypothetical protein
MCSLYTARQFGLGSEELSLPGRRVHLLYFRTQERKKENLVYEKISMTLFDNVLPIFPVNSIFLSSIKN